MGCISTTPKKQDGAKSATLHSKKNFKAGTASKQQGVKELKSNYVIDKSTQILGSGAFGKVFRTTNKHDKSFEVAVKVMDKHKLERQDTLSYLMEEVAILNTLDHPNICKYYETYDDKKYIYLVMEYIKGGQLFDKITSQENQVFTEADARKYMRDLFSAINHCHAQGIIHRDIKPENVMVTDSGDLKLIDFGLAKAGKTKNLKTIAGTPYYMAPEVLDGKYGLECDFWSLGVILYVIVSGYLPFQGKRREEVFRKIQDGDYHFNHVEFKTISDDCKRLIGDLLQVNPKHRIKGIDVLKHPWFSNKEIAEDSGADRQLDIEVINRLREFKGVSTLRKAALNMMVKMIDDRELDCLKKKFQEYDEDGTGMIKANELANVLRKQNLNMSSQQVEDLINEIDYHGNGMINYTEFLSATVSINKFMTEERLLAIFNQFDTNNTGYITEENITLAMEKMGQKISQQEVQQIIQKHDLTKNNKLSFEEFQAVFEKMDQPFGSEGPNN